MSQSPKAKAPSSPRPNGESTADPKLKHGSVGGQSGRDQAPADPATGRSPGDKHVPQAPAQVSDHGAKRAPDHHERREAGDPRDNFKQPYVQQDQRGKGDGKGQVPGPATKQ